MTTCRYDNTGFCLVHTADHRREGYVDPQADKADTREGERTMTTAANPGMWGPGINPTLPANAPLETDVATCQSGVTTGPDCLVRCAAFDTVVSVGQPDLLPPPGGFNTPPRSIEDIADKIERAILDRAPTWEEPFDGGPGQVVGVRDAAITAAQEVVRGVI